MNDLLGYEGKNIVVTGGASGMGAAVVQLLLKLKANVYVLDINASPEQETHSILVNLANKESIDEAVAQLPQSIESVFSCAGIAGTSYGKRIFTTIDVMKINFLGAKYLIESIIPKMPEGSTIATVSSLAGMSWMQKLAMLTPLVTAKSYEEGLSWVEENINKPEVMSQDESDNGSYGLSKEALIAWVKYRSFSLASLGIKLNNISPSTTTTPMLQDFNEIAKKDVTSGFISPIGRAAVAEDQANALLLINSNLNTYISGQDLQVDYAVTSQFFFPPTT